MSTHPHISESITLTISSPCSLHPWERILFCNWNFENTDNSLNLFYISYGSSGGEAEESWQHLLFTMAGDPLSVALPPSLSTVACSTKAGIKDVPMNEKATEIGQEMNDFMPDVDSIEQDNNTSCFNSNPSLTLLLAEGLHDTGIKDAPIPQITTKNVLKLPASLMDDDPTSQDE